MGLNGEMYYSVMGTYSIVDGTGNIINRLIRLKSPTGSDASYTGNWNDNSASWSQSNNTNIPYVNNINDGIFFIESIDFINIFTSYSVTF